MLHTAERVPPLRKTLALSLAFVAPALDLDALLRDRDDIDD
jgi:hypothetical protein